MHELQTEINNEEFCRAEASPRTGASNVPSAAAERGAARTGAEQGLRDTRLEREASSCTRYVRGLQLEGTSTAIERMVNGLREGPASANLAGATDNVVMAYAVMAYIVMAYRWKPRGCLGLRFGARGG